ncbi:EscU/YscU/HrcU family type III secretion system export apparatus switch protein [Massilia endophytica]|uniref:EscU/YscU/HrcU family type III secretion system export apparatus switch protein n=1 Tax=Massilia endophytica TaxID=2899220 RepID=UPI001E5957B6|nr:EscU/YscU/HrcU family type III secretion system export apparatus switch protein [Massilia endophytica]UGQ47957.1 EscU/YscU/HrcU family type III secretion system export apparatus switch protein [Massilia endophytica]
MAEQDDNRSEPATPHKLREARKRGQVAKSPDAAFVVVLAALVAVWFAAAAGSGRRALSLSAALLTRLADLEWTPAGAMAWVGGWLQAGLALLAPALVAVAGGAILGQLMQAGPVLSAHPLKPDLQRLNPASGLKRLMSMRLVYEAAKSVVKLSVLGLVLILLLRAVAPRLGALQFGPAPDVARQALAEVGPLLFKLLLALLAVALADAIYTRWEFARKMRMSRRDITDEHKQREGDPRIRERLREVRLELLKQTRSLSQVAKADVLLTNPTHYAVAISYRHGEMPAPKLLAKGAGELAARMRESARRHRIPIVENPPLARELHRRLTLDEYVPEDLYPAVAKILLWVYALRANRRAG